MQPASPSSGALPTMSIHTYMCMAISRLRACCRLESKAVSTVVPFGDSRNSSMASY